MSNEKSGSSMNIVMNFRNFKWWQQCIAILCIAVLLGAVGYAASQGIVAIGNITLRSQLQTLWDEVNVPLNSTTSAFIKESSYIVSQQEGYYLLWNGTADRAGKLEFFSTNASQVINDAGGNLTHTYPQTVYLIGNFTVSSNILVWSYETLLINGNIIETSFVDIITLANPNTNNYGVNIEGVGAYAYLYGPWQYGMASQYWTGCGINLTVATGYDIYSSEISNLEIQNIGDSGVRILNGERMLLDHISVGGTQTCGNRCFWLSIFSDSRILDCGGGSQNANFYFEYGGADDIEGLYAGGGAYGSFINGVWVQDPAIIVNQFAGSIFSDIRADSSATDGIYVTGGNANGYHNTWTNVQASSPRTAGYSAIHLFNGQNNIFSSVFIYQYGLTGPLWTNGICLQGASYNDIFSMMSINNCTTAITGLNNTPGYADTVDYSTVQINGVPATNAVTPYSYVVSTDGTNYYLKDGTTGLIDFYGTNASAVFNAAIGNLSLTPNRGTIDVKAGNYNLTNTILFKGRGDYQTGGTLAQFSLIGEGRNSTVFVPASGVDAITIENYAPVCLKDFSIMLPSGGGNGIAAYNVTGYDGPTFEGSVFDNLYINGGSKWGMYLENPSFTTFRDIYIVGGSYGCICMNQTDNLYPWGDITFEGTNLLSLTGPNSIGMLFTNATGMTKSINLVFNTGYLSFLSWAGNTNTTGIWADNLSCSHFQNLNIQGITVGIYANYCRGCIFSGDDEYDSPNILVQTTSSASANIFRDFSWYAPSGNQTAFIDADTNINLPDVYEGWTIYSAYNVNNTVTFATIVSNIYWQSWIGTKQGFSGGPVGYISSPILSSTNLVDFGGSGTIANNTLYTVYGSPKNIYISGGTVSSVQVDGQTIFTATGCLVHVEPGDTFKIVWSSQPTIVVIGQ